MYQKSTRTTRYIIRAERARAGLFPLALLGLLFIILPLLYMLFSYAKNNIEANTRVSVSEALQQAGFNGVKVEVDGQFVTLRGEGSPQAAQQARSAAAASRAGTWLGKLSAPRAIEVDFASPVSAELPAIKKPADKPPQNNTQRHWSDIVNTLHAGVFTLSGQVGSSEEKRALIQNAKQALHTPSVQRISHELTLRPEATEGAMEVAMLATTLLSHCESGESAANKGVISLHCKTTAAGASAIEALKSQVDTHGRLGEFSVEVIDHCATELAAQLKATHILFDVGSYTLPPATAAQFDAIADHIRACPQLLRIEGHTDTTGDHAYNMNLSFQRAMAGVEALAARGISRKYLVPYIYGPDQPHSSEGSARAKASNRRIEIHLFNEEDSY